MSFSLLLSKMFNRPAYNALVEQKLLIEQLSLADWFKKIPAGLYQTDKDEWLNVKRDNNRVTITRAPTANGSDKDIFDSTTLCYDGMGFKYCYVQVVDMDLTYRRYDAIDCGDNDDINLPHDNARRTKDSKLNTLFAIRKIGDRFYDQEDIKIIIN